MNRDDPKDRSTIARLGGLTAQELLTPEQRAESARLRGESTLAKHGKAHYLRMALIRHGKLAPKNAKTPAG